VSISAKFIEQSINDSSAGPKNRDNTMKKCKEGGMFTEVSGIGINISEEPIDTIFKVPFTFQKLMIFIFKALRT
jgi:hypothetical protein